MKYSIAFFSCLITNWVEARGSEWPFEYSRKEGKIKTNVTTTGVVIIGTNPSFSSTNPHEYPVDGAKYPTEDTQDLIARLGCQNQKKYSPIKYLKWLNYYHDTTCPGTISDYVSQIKILTTKYGMLNHDD